MGVVLWGESEGWGAGFAFTAIEIRVKGWGKKSQPGLTWFTEMGRGNQMRSGKGRGNRSKPNQIEGKLEDPIILPRGLSAKGN